MASTTINQTEPVERPDSPENKSNVVPTDFAKIKTPAFEKGDEVALRVIEDGYMSKKELYVASVEYSSSSNKFKYQLKETEDSQTMYEGGKWYAEKELKHP